jgi:hypothetical protein
MKTIDNLPPEFDAVKDDDESIFWTGQPALIPFLAQGIPFAMGSVRLFLFHAIHILWRTANLYQLVYVAPYVPVLRKHHQYDSLNPCPS